MFETVLDRHVSSLIGEIRGIAQELKAYRGIAHEQIEIIKQLSGQPTEDGVTYIHPFDLHILMDHVRCKDVWYELRGFDSDTIQEHTKIGDVRYKASAFMPVHFKGIIR